VKYKNKIIITSLISCILFSLVFLAFPPQKQYTTTAQFLIDSKGTNLQSSLLSAFGMQNDQLISSDNLPYIINKNIIFYNNVIENNPTLRREVIKLFPKLNSSKHKQAEKLSTFVTYKSLSNRSNFYELKVTTKDSAFSIYLTQIILSELEDLYHSTYYLDQEIYQDSLDFEITQLEKQLFKTLKTNLKLGDQNKFQIFEEDSYNQRKTTTEMLVLTEKYKELVKFSMINKSKIIYKKDLFKYIAKPNFTENKYNFITQLIIAITLNLSALILLYLFKWKQS
jgi:hypothetical protein